MCQNYFLKYRSIKFYSQIDKMLIASLVNVGVCNAQKIPHGIVLHSYTNKSQRTDIGR